jgi:drug/metabolite transporter (DMT)-like permease
VKNLKAHLAVLGTNLFFASNFSFVKFVSPGFIQPFAVNVLRVGLSMILFWAVWLFGKTKAGFDRKDLPRFIACALTGVAINQTLFIKGLTLTTTSHAALLMLVTPLLVTLFALWVLKEKFTFAKAAGLACGVGGAVFLVMQKENNANAPDYLFGDFLILLNSIAYSVYFIIVNPLMEKYSALHVIRWVFTIGFIMVLPFGWSQTANIHWQQMEAAHYLAITGVVVTGTFLAYYFNAYGISRLGAGITGTYIYTQPVFAVLIAYLFFNDSVSNQKLIAAVLIFSGVYLVSIKKKKN